MKIAQNTRGMQTIRVQTTQNVFIHYPVASVGDRILAFIIDRIILIIYTVAIVAWMINFNVEVPWLWIILLGFPWVFYHLVFEIFMNGQTPGKRVMSIQVVRMDGTSPSVGNYILRWLVGFIDFYVFSGIVAVIVVATNGKGQRLGDLAAGTSVVKQTPQEQITARDIFVMPDDSYTPTFSQVMQLSSQDIELINRALAANQEQGNLQPVLIVTDKVKTMLGIQTDMPPVQFLYTVVKDFNHLTSR